MENKMSTAPQKIKLMSESEWAELSLAETLCVEEAVCDAAEPLFLTETAVMPNGASDMPEIAGDFDKYQFFNQDQIAGIGNDDLEDMFDPDSKNPSSTELSEEVATHTSLNKDGDIDAAETAPEDSPSPDDIGEVIKKLGTTGDLKDSVSGHEQPVSETASMSASDMMAMLLGEDTVTNDFTNDNDISSDEGEESDDEGEEDEGDFDESDFLSRVDDEDMS